MKRLPSILAFFFVTISLWRVSDFMSNGLHLGFLGVLFAIGVAVAVYVSAYFTQHEKTRWAALVGLVFFGFLDVYFNTLEMVRTLSGLQIVSAGSTFLKANAVQLTNIFQWSALVYGVIPTLSAAQLGWLQSDAEKVAILNRRSWIAAFFKAISATLQKGIVANLENQYHISAYRQIEGGKSGKQLEVSDDTVIDADALNGKVRWEDLLATQKTEIAGMSTRQIVSKWHISERSARNWKARVEAGE